MRLMSLNAAEIRQAWQVTRSMKCDRAVQKRCSILNVITSRGQNNVFCQAEKTFSLSCSPPPLCLFYLKKRGAIVSVVKDDKIKITGNKK